MRKAYQNINVNLNLLTESISDFFKNKGFEVTIEKLKNGCQICAQNSIYYKIKEPISVFIYGKSHDFSVELREGKKNESFGYPIILTTFIGGGFLIREKFRSEEEKLRLGKDFWNYVNMAVNSLRNTANKEKTEDDATNEN